MPVPRELVFAGRTPAPTLSGMTETPTHPAPTRRAPTRVPSSYRSDRRWRAWRRRGHSGGRPRTPTASTARSAAENVYAIDTPPPTVSGSLHVGHVFSYTHTDLIARYQRMTARASSTRWAGTTTACRPSVACRTTTASAATRRCRTTRLHPAGEARPEEQVPDQPAQLHRAVRAARPRGREEVRGSVAPLGSLGRLAAALHDHRTQGPEGQPDRVPAELRPWRGLPAGGAHPVGRHLPDRRRPGGARGARLPRRLPPGLVPLGIRTAVHRDDPPELIPSVGGPHRPPRRRALPGAVRHDRHEPGLRRRDPGRGPPGSGDGQGLGPGHVLHLR
jgi:hypothetical protein